MTVKSCHNQELLPDSLDQTSSFMMLKSTFQDPRGQQVVSAFVYPLLTPVLFTLLTPVLLSTTFTTDFGKTLHYLLFVVCFLKFSLGSFKFFTEPEFLTEIKFALGNFGCARDVQLFCETKSDIELVKSEDEIAKEPIETQEEKQEQSIELEVLEGDTKVNEYESEKNKDIKDTGKAEMHQENLKNKVIGDHLNNSNITGISNTTNNNSTTNNFYFGHKKEGKSKSNKNYFEGAFRPEAKPTIGYNPWEGSNKFRFKPGINWANSDHFLIKIGPNVYLRTPFVPYWWYDRYFNYYYGWW